MHVHTETQSNLRHTQKRGMHSRESNRRSKSTGVRLKCIALGAAGAGKTSILRRYFLGTFQHGRVPTVGADFYTNRVQYPHTIANENNKHDDDEKKIVDDASSTSDTGQNPLWLSLQMWDTAGRKRFVAKDRDKYSTTALSDAFFRQAHAAMLVYDATSSTSFTQLLQWHSDLMERIKHLQRDRRKGRENSCPFPVLIVANKMDLFKSDVAQPERRTTAPQRDVMGLGGNFKGRDFRYEYRAARDTSDSTKTPTRREEISTYMVTGNTWTTDGSYLDSVLNTEDRSHPDRDMVLLWCMRNGLKHFEVSALDGTGIEAAMDALVALALESENQRQADQKEEETKLQKHNVSAKPDYHEWSNKQLDLHHRYAPKENESGCWRPIWLCKK